MDQRPPQTQFARPGANPSLRKIELIRIILQKAHGPVSRNQILARLEAWEHGTSRASLNAALGFFASEGALVEGSKGLQWAAPATGNVLETIRRKRS